jgi:hypothetical protein
MPSRDEEVRRQLRHLVVVYMLCPEGSPALIAFEGLILMTLERTGWVDPVSAGLVMDKLVPRLRLGEVYDINPGFVRSLLHERTVPLGPGNFVRRPGPATLAEARVEAEHVLALREEFAGACQDAELFEAWLLNRRKHGWQSEYGESRTPPQHPSTTSRRLDRMRTDLREFLLAKKCFVDRGVADEDRFADAVEQAELMRADAAGGEDVAAPGPPPDSPADDPDHEVSHWIRRRLEDRLLANSDWEAVIALFVRGEEESTVAARFPDYRERLDAVHDEFLGARAELQDELELLRFYRGVGDGRNNLLRARDEASPGWPEELRRRAEEVVALARSGVPFAELPAALTRTLEETLAALDQLRLAFRQWDNRRRGRGQAGTEERIP